MAKRRGEDVQEQGPAPQEVPAGEDFPTEVSAADAPEAAADPTGEPGEPGEVAEESAPEPPPVNPFDVTREFRKHVRTGEVVAVELAGGQLQGARLCSRPEEQTEGALPVMALDNRESDVCQWYRKNAMDFRPWEPPQPPKQLMDRLRSLYEQAVEARAAYDRAKNAAKFAKERVEEIDDAIFHALRRMHDVPDGQVELPLEPEQAEAQLPLEEPLHMQATAGGPNPDYDPAKDELAAAYGFDKPANADDTEDRDERLAAAEEE